MKKTSLLLMFSFPVIIHEKIFVFSLFFIRVDISPESWRRTQSKSTKGTQLLISHWMKGKMQSNTESSLFDSFSQYWKGNNEGYTLMNQTCYVLKYHKMKKVWNGSQLSGLDEYSEACSLNCNSKLNTQGLQKRRYNLKRRTINW